MCALWSNEDDITTDTLMLTGYDIIDGMLTEHPEVLPVKRIDMMFSEVYYDKRRFGDDVMNGVILSGDGLEVINDVKIRVKSLFNDNVIGYMVAQSSGFDNPDLNSSLGRAVKYNGNGFYLRCDNYLEKLPMFAASRYITYNGAWTERARVMKSADGAEKFNSDVANGKLSQFLLKCLLFTCVEMQNHMRTFTGTDGRFYRNELCLDSTNGDTIASRDIQSLNVNDAEKAILDAWEKVLEYAKKTNNVRGKYDSDLTYGVYQINKALDTSVTVGQGKNKRKVYDNIELHSALSALKGLVSVYYNAEIVPTLFEYEFVK
ncbi:hypothetical protein FACS1894120_6320 [Clostridia bacterium]|nr:hypothetical protein FACS1894120_6320 [Clostridia bacterium]